MFSKFSNSLVKPAMNQEITSQSHIQKQKGMLLKVTLVLFLKVELKLHFHHLPDE